MTVVNPQMPHRGGGLKTNMRGCFYFTIAGGAPAN
jgi:hypothetical protein